MVDTPADLDEVRDYLAEFPEIVREPRAADAAGDRPGAARGARRSGCGRICEAEGFVFCPRKQIEWYGPVRGT